MECSLIKIVHPPMPSLVVGTQWWPMGQTKPAEGQHSEKLTNGMNTKESFNDDPQRICFESLDQQLWIKFEEEAQTSSPRTIIA